MVKARRRSAKEPELVTKKEFASRIERTPARVSQLLKEGLPVRPDGMIDLARGLSWYSQHLTREPPAKTATSEKNGAGDIKAEKVPGGSNGNGADPRARPQANNDGSDYARSRAAREQHQAELKGIEVARLRGELVSKAEVECAAAFTARRLRESLMGIPDRIAATAAAEKDPRLVHEIIAAEIEKTLETLADDIGGD